MLATVQTKFFEEGNGKCVYSSLCTPISLTMGSNENLNINPSGPGASQASNTAEALKPSIGSQDKSPKMSHRRLPDDSVNPSGVQQSPLHGEVRIEDRSIRKNQRK